MRTQRAPGATQHFLRSPLKSLRAAGRCGVQAAAKMLAQPPGGPQAAPQLDSLDDHQLLAVLSHLAPFPDRFNIAASCRRLRDLALDRRSWLYVTHAAAEDEGATSPGGAAGTPASQHLRRRRSLQPAPSAASLGSAAAAAGGEPGVDGAHWYRSQFATLAAALAASRPGDTILLEAGPVPHRVAATLVVTHPVHILGGGAAAEECVVEGARGIEALLDFRASGRLANLTLKATAGACVAHTRGRLTVQGCTLECDACGLPHLAAPLITRAVSGSAVPVPAAPPVPLPLPPTPRAGDPPAVGGAAGPPLPAGSKRPAADSAAAAAPPAKRPCTWLAAGGAAAAGAGVLSVAETRVKAQGLAVDLRGSGQLAGVRAIYSTGHALIWLEVDSANAAAPPPALPAAAAAGSGAMPVSAAPAHPASAAGAVPLAAPAFATSLRPAGAQPPGTPLPSWAAKAAAAGFNAAAFQEKARLLAGALPPSGPAAAQAAMQPSQQQQQPAPADKGGQIMEQKAEAWCLLHHSTLAAPPQPPPRQAQQPQD